MRVILICDEDDNILDRYTVQNEDAQALAMALSERNRQDDKWGEQNHSPVYWSNIDGEEWGEAAKEANKYEFTVLESLGITNRSSPLVRLLYSAVHGWVGQLLLGRRIQMAQRQAVAHLDAFETEMTETAAVALAAVASVIRQRQRELL